MYTFDGPNKLIILDTGVITLEVADLYSRWKEWLILGDNAKYLPAFDNSVGGNALGGGTNLGSYYFLQNGWRIKPQEADHKLTVIGNLFAVPDTADVFKITDTNRNVQIVQQVSSLTQTVSTTGGSGDGITAGEVTNAVWNADKSLYNNPGTMGEVAQTTLLTVKNTFALAASGA